MQVRVEELQDVIRRISGQIGYRGLSLVRLSVACRWPVYRGEAPGRKPIFVKVARPEEVRNTLAILASAGPCMLLPRPILTEPLDFGEYSVLCLEWIDSSILFAEKMTDLQLESFCDGCVALSKSLSQVTALLSVKRSDDLELQYAALVGFVTRHHLAGILLRELVEIPTAERTYGARPMVPIHGDLQPKNYGFDGSRMAAVYDLEEVRLGLACEDATYAFMERCRHLSGKCHRRLVSLFLKLIELSPWPMDEWLIAVNHCRLRIASRRLAKHPDGLFVAFDIWRRDRPLRKLYDIIREKVCVHH